MEIRDAATTRRTLDVETLKANRYYVGSKGALFNNWGHGDLPAAIRHAAALLDKTNGEDQFVVKIVKIIRRKPTPVIVEDVK